MKKILCALLAAAMLLTLCACGGSTKNEATYNDAGYYEIFSVDEGDETLTRSDFESMGWTIFLQLNDDGTGILDMDDGDITELTWKDGTINDGASDIPYVLAGGMLTLDLSGSDDTFVMIFKKGTAPAAPAGEDAAAVSSFADRFSRTGSKSGDKDDTAEEDTENTPEPEPEETPASAPAGDFTPVSGTIGDYSIEILSAEPFLDSNGKDAVRFYFDFTNNSDIPTSAAWEMSFEAEEDGYELVSTYASYEDDVPEYGNVSLSVEPGVTIRCIQEFSFRPDGSELIFTISPYDEDGIVATFDPQALPGRPGDWSPELISDPQYFLDYPLEGSSDDAYVIINSAEIVDSDSWFSDAPVMRAYFEYTNQEDEESYCMSNLTIRAYQDGIELNYGFPEEAVDSDNKEYTDIAAGETIDISLCWELRSDSPIEVAVTDWWSDEVLCAGTFYPE